METLTRQIYFYQAHPQNASFQEIINELGLLADDDKCSKYNDGQQAFCLLEQGKGGVIKGRLCAWRNSDFPFKSTIDDLEIVPLKLAENDGLVEITHFVYFPEKDILGLEYNYQGPRIGKLTDHINKKLNAVGVEKPRFVDFTPLFDSNTLKQLDKMGEIRAISLMVPKNHLDSIKGLDANIHGALSSAMNFGELEEVELVLRPKKNGRKPILKKPKEFIERLRKLATTEHLSKIFDELKIKAYDTSQNSYREFDLLKDKMVSEVSAIKLNEGKGVDSEDMFQKIELSYKTKHDDLIRVAHK